MGSATKLLTKLNPVVRSGETQTLPRILYMPQATPLKAINPAPIREGTAAEGNIKYTKPATATKKAAHCTPLNCSLL